MKGKNTFINNNALNFQKKVAYRIKEFVQFEPHLDI